MKTLALYNLKGGVGKTAAAVNLAFLAADYGHRTLLWDLDPQGAASWYLGVEPAPHAHAKKLVRGKLPIGEFLRPTAYERLDVLPANLSNRHLDRLLDAQSEDPEHLAGLIAPLGETYSLLVLDCPPSLSRLSANVFRAADVIALPLIPTPLSVRAYEQVVEVLAKAKIRDLKLYAFLSMLDRRRGMHRELASELPQRIKTLLQTAIPYAAAVEQMGRRRAPLTAYDTRSEAGRAFESLWRELEAVLRLR